MIFKQSSGSVGLWLMLLGLMPLCAAAAEETRLFDIRSGSDSSNPYEFIAAPSGAVYFAATTAKNGRELFKADSSGVALVKDIATTGTTLPPSSNPADMAVMGGIVYFRADDGVHGAELWRSAGTAATTWMVANLRADPKGAPAGSLPTELRAIGSTLFFHADDGIHGRELWVSDGTGAGTHRIATTASPSYTNPSYLVAAGNRLFFRATDSAHGEELWVSDGTAAGTKIVGDIRSGSADGLVRELCALGDGVLFSANDGVNGSQLWRATGTPPLLRRLTKSNTAGSFAPANLTAINGWVYFSADDGANGREPWRCDGTTVGLRMIYNIRPGLASSGPQQFTKLGSWIYFSADDGTHGRELWRTDGTNNTALFADIFPGSSGGVPNASSPDTLAVYSDMLYFVAGDAAHGRELWRTAGTSATTGLFKDICPGKGSSYVQSLTPTVTGCFFSANDGTHGDELWRITTRNGVESWTAWR